MAYFDLIKEIELVIDASPWGLICHPSGQNKKEVVTMGVDLCLM